MDGVDAGTKAALALGAFGSLVGLLNLGLKAIEVWRDRATIKIRFSEGHMMYLGAPPITAPPHRPEDPLAFLHVWNTGRRPTTLSGAGITFKDGSPWEFVGDRENLPRRLDEGNHVTLWMRQESLNKQIWEHGMPKYFWAQDATGKKHKSRIPQELRSRFEQLGQSQESGGRN